MTAPVYDSNQLPFEVLEPTLVFGTGLVYRIALRSDPFTVVAIVENRSEPTVQEALNDDGGGSFKLLANDPKLLDEPRLLDYGNVVRVSINGVTVQAFEIVNRTVSLVSGDEQSGEYIEVSGPTYGAEVFRRSAVYPAQGLRPSSPGSRFFNFASERGDWYIVSDWGNPVFEYAQTDNSTANPWSSDPLPWPAEWPDAMNKNWVSEVVVASNTNIPLMEFSSTPKINGIGIIPGDRVLLQFQTITARNGVYIYQGEPTYPAWSAAIPYITGAVVKYAGEFYRSKLDSNLNHTPAANSWWSIALDVYAFVRTDDMVSGADFNDAVVMVSKGTWANKIFAYTGAASPSVNTTPITFALFTTGVKWAWDRVSVRNGATAPAGDLYFRYEFTTTHATDLLTLFMTADDWAFGYIDGQRILDVVDRPSYKRTYSATMSVFAGPHVLGIRAKNLQGYAGLLFALSLQEQEEDVPQWIFSGDGGPLVLNAYPDPAPGWTTAEVVQTLLAEATTRGVDGANNLGVTFTNFVDSVGESWVNPIEWELPIGSSMRDMLDMFAENYSDWGFDPINLELSLWIQRGRDRSVQTPEAEPVILRQAKNVRSAGIDGVAPSGTVVLVRSDDGWSERSADGDAITAYGRREAFLSLGRVVDSTAQTIASNQIASVAYPSQSLTIDIWALPGSTPWEDFGVGDFILAPDEGGTLVKRRVVSISASEDEESAAIIYAVELDTVRKTEVQKISRWLKAIGGGTLGGEAVGAVVIPASPPSSMSSTSAQQGSTGPRGFSGAPGAAGASIISGSGTPDSLLGRDGDYFLDRSDQVLYGPKVVGLWPGTGLLLRGSTILSGVGPPALSTGNDGDFFLDPTDQILYGPKSTGAWPAVGLLFRGATIISGASAPGAGVGEDGDYFLDSVTQTFYGPKDSGVWPASGILLHGSAILSGIVDPVSGDGEDGDYFFNRITTVLFGPKASGSWSGTGTQLRGSVIWSGIIDPVSGDGEDGDYFLNKTSFELFGPKTVGSWSGSIHLQGSIIHEGSGAPGAGVGVDGDYYWDGTAKSLYGPKAAGSWPSGVSLIGPSGAAGAAGAGSGNMNYVGDWDSATVYQADDVVDYSGDTFLRTTYTGIVDGSFDYAQWHKIAFSPARRTSTMTTVSLSPLAREQGTMNLARGYKLYALEVTSPARVRVYATTAQQSADASRAFGLDPTGNHGVMLDYMVAHGPLSRGFSPMVDGMSLEASPTESIPITVDNVDSSTAVITVTLTWIRTE